MPPHVRGGRLIASIGALLLFAVGCAERAALTTDMEDETIAEADRYGGTAVIAIATDIEGLLPLTTRLSDAHAVAGDMLFLPLLTMTPELEPEPLLARSWELSPDSSRLTFHLRDDVYWHDGVKTTAYDVEFTYRRALDPNTGYSGLELFSRYGNAVASDSFTFVVEIAPYSDYLVPWSLLLPVPRHLLEEIAPAELGLADFAIRPVGNGPFRFASRSPGQSWTFEANDAFADALGGRPYLDRVMVRTIPDATARTTELLTGTVQFVIRMPAAQIPTVERSSTARLIAVPNTSFTFIPWNSRRPPFEDVRVRRALTMAIDRQGIVDGLLGGHGQVAHSTVSPENWQYDAEAGADLRYDPAGARRLLAEAGWEDRDGDGTLEDARGRPFRFTFMTQPGGQAADAVEKVAADLRAVGVRAEIRALEGNTIFERMNSRDFDAVALGFGLGPTPEDGVLFACPEGKEGPHMYSGICDPELDRLRTQALAMIDREAAMPVWAAYQRRLSELQPATFLFHAEFVNGVGMALRDARPDITGALNGIERWWLRKDSAATD